MRQPLHGPLESSQGGQGLGVSYGPCGVCARAMSHWVRTRMSPSATTSLGSRSCSECCWGWAVTQERPYAALPCPSSPGQCPRDSRGTPRGAMGTMGPWTVFPSPGGAASSHAPFELGKRQHRWHGTCPCTALLSHSAPQTSGVPPSLIPARAVDAFQPLQCAFCLFCVPWTADASGARFSRVPGSPPADPHPPPPGQGNGALDLLHSSFGLHGGGDSHSWDKGAVTSMAHAPSPLYGTGQARGQQLQEHGQDLECFWESAGAGRTCPVP